MKANTKYEEKWEGPRFGFRQHSIFCQVVGKSEKIKIPMRQAKHADVVFFCSMNSLTSCGVKSVLSNIF